MEVALDLNELESVTMQRRDVRDDLEKAIALWKATGKFYDHLLVPIEQGNGLFQPFLCSIPHDTELL